MSTLLNKTRISYIIDNLNIGGAQVHLSRLVKELKQNFDIELITLESSPQALISDIPPEIPITSLNMATVRNYEFWCSFANLVIHLKKRKPKIVHTYLNTSNVFGLMAAKIAGVKHVITSRRDMGHFRSKRIAVLESVLCRLFASEVFCVCKAVARDTHVRECIPVKKLRVIYNGVDIKKFKPKTSYPKDHGIRFAMVAAMDRPAKGHEDFIRAAALALQKTSKTMQFYLIGDGPLRKDLERITKEINVRTSIKFLGAQRNLEKIVSEMDVLVVPSHSEGISNAALEAMASGLPVIATGIDGNLELVFDERTGIIVPSRDRQSLCKALMRYAMEPDIVELHGKEAYKRIKEHFDVVKMKCAYLNAYSRLI